MKNYILFLFLTIPALAQTNVIATAGYSYPDPLPAAPGQVLTLFVPGPPGDGLSVTLHQGSDFPAPILAVTPSPDNSTTAVTVQIPFELNPPCSAGPCPAIMALTTLTVTANNVTGPPFELTPLPERIHFLTTCDSVVGGGGITPLNGLPCPPFVTHADGSLVSAANPAQADEELVAYAVGLGATTPAVPTGTAPGNPAPAHEFFILDFDYHPNALPAQPVHFPFPVALTRYARPQFAGLTAGFVGLYQVNFIVAPPSQPITPCGASVQSNLTVSMGGTFTFDGFGLCVNP